MTPKRLIADPRFTIPMSSEVWKAPPDICDRILKLVPPNEMVIIKLRSLADQETAHKQPPEEYDPVINSRFPWMTIDFSLMPSHERIWTGGDREEKLARAGLIAEPGDPLMIGTIAYDSLSVEDRIYAPWQGDQTFGRTFVRASLDVTALAAATYVAPKTVALGMSIGSMVRPGVGTAIGGLAALGMTYCACWWAAETINGRLSE